MGVMVAMQSFNQLGCKVYHVIVCMPHHASAGLRLNPELANRYAAQDHRQWRERSSRWLGASSKTFSCALMAHSCTERVGESTPSEGSGHNVNY